MGQFTHNETLDQGHAAADGAQDAQSTVIRQTKPRPSRHRIETAEDILSRSGERGRAPGGRCGWPMEELVPVAGEETAPTRWEGSEVSEQAL